MYEVRLPQWGMEMTEGTVVKWYKAEGEHIEKGEPLADIEFAKTTGTLDAPVSGTVAKIVAELQEDVLIYGLLAVIDDGGTS
jgi:pyruvate dehydrogenase E2 component (dihydrolipoamide acetyltransferase)